MNGASDKVYARSYRTERPEIIITKEFPDIVFDRFYTPLVKLILSKESKGSYNTGWQFNPKTKKISDGSLQTFYDGNKMNKAHYSARKTIETLQQTKRMIDDVGGYEVVRLKTLLKLQG
ncbi:hypothetical protein [Conservatibacter flavescens]|uniref:Uncharacterized protein n=1 Tax=Conservatibacter flavescens TaxID=28161 RepID=A0A2M8RZH3_9PAST|nr:hypothetical protein [Conservatibacter flavescens]PJG84291.1 hypothetical protein CVP05_12105 [Conservatibacter flavescens]